MGGKGQDLVTQTELAIQQYLEEDIDKYCNTIRTLEEISYQLWVESNTQFLDESMMSSDDDLEWDDDPFIYRFDYENENVAEDARVNEEQFDDWVVIEDNRKLCNTREENDWLVLSTVIYPESDCDTSLCSIGLLFNKHKNNIQKGSDSYIEVPFETSANSGSDLSDWAVLSMAVTEVAQCDTNVMNVSVDSGIKSPSSAKEPGSPVGYGDFYDECTCMTSPLLLRSWSECRRVTSSEWTVQVLDNGSRSNHFKYTVLKNINMSVNDISGVNQTDNTLIHIFIACSLQLKYKLAVSQFCNSS